MKEIIKRITKYILFDTLLYAIVICLLGLILNLVGYVFLKWFINLSIVLIIGGIIIGTIQLVNKISNKKIKVILKIVFIVIEVIVLLPIVCLFFFFQDFESFVFKDGSLMIKETHSFLFSNWINYYDFQNIFIRKKNERIYEAYDDSLQDYLYTIYYDDNGKPINNKDNYVNDSKDEDIDNSNENKNDNIVDDELDKIYNKVLYENKFDDNTIIRIVAVDYILAQRTIVSVEKSFDGGTTWKRQLENNNDLLIIHNGAEFSFINENVGFINDFGVAGTGGDNRLLLVTTNGGKSFEKATIKVDQLNEVLYIQDVPYIEDDILKIKADVYSDSGIEKIILYSVDNGITWSEIDNKNSR